MGKIKKLRTRATKSNASQHSTHLTEDLAGAEIDNISSKRIKERYQQEESDIVDSKLTKKILNAARKQQESLEGHGIDSFKHPSLQLKTLKDESDDEDYPDEQTYNSSDAQFME